MHQNNADLKFRVKIEKIDTMYRQKYTKELFHKGGVLEFKEPFTYGSRDQSITGTWRFAGSTEYRPTIEMHNEETGEKVSAPAKKLYKYIVRNIAQGPELEEGDSIHIDVFISVLLPDVPEVPLSDDVYAVKSFLGGMATILIQNNTGQCYRLATKNIAEILI